MNAFESVRPRAELRPSPPLRRQPTPRLSSHIVVGNTPIDVVAPSAGHRPSKWQAGPPPHVGWWLTKTPKEGGKSNQEWRWWDGACWSCPVRSGASARLAAQAAWQASYRDDIRWCYEWPDGARVQRINPVTGEVTGG